MRRESVPRSLERAVLMEAGHRCAIPTCQAIPVEIVHIVPWHSVREHKFENLIALCPNCHTRYDKGEIDRKSILQYKANLSVINSRYGDMEKRVLSCSAQRPEARWMVLPNGLDILLYYLLADRFLQKLQDPFVPAAQDDAPDDTEFVLASDKCIHMVRGGSVAIYDLTTAGREFIQCWLSAHDVG